MHRRYMTLQVMASAQMNSLPLTSSRMKFLGLASIFEYLMLLGRHKKVLRSQTLISYSQTGKYSLLGLKSTLVPLRMSR